MFDSMPKNALNTIFTWVFLKFHGGISPITSYSQDLRRGNEYCNERRIAIEFKRPNLKVSVFFSQKMESLLRRTFRPINKDLVRRSEQNTAIWKCSLTCALYLLEILDRNEDRVNC